MSQLERLKNLSASHCVLLAAHYATSSNITALRALTALREADLPLELILSILLTYLPEQLHPSSYIEYLGDLATDSRNPGDNPATALDISSVEGISNSRAKKRRQALELVSVIHPTYSAETELDVFSHFLIHRAHRIDSEVGLLDTTPELVAPFLESSEYLRTWFISTVLPLLRLSYEYYPQSASCSLDEFARLKGRRAVDYQLSHCHNASGERVNDLPRDIKGVVAPWLCGASDRKRRRISNDAESSTVAQGQTEQPGDWDHLFRWLLDSSRNHLDLINAAFKEWDGPDQMDLGGFEDGRDYVEEEEQRKLEMKYAQTALACIYISAKSDKDSFRIVDALFKRICGLLNFDSSPAFEENKSAVQDLEVPFKWSTSMLKEENLLDLGNEMTKPRNASLHVLEMLLFSAARLSSLEHPMSIRDVASILLRKDQQEQLLLLQKILNTLGNGSQKEDQWSTTRRKLVWLWDWGNGHQSETRPGQGIFGMIERKTLESEILKTLIQGGHYSLAIETYLSSRFAYKLLSPSDVEQVVLTCAMNFYDNASNGNRSRGNMKRASEIIAAFAPHFPSSSRFQRIQALLAATHAMSFYSLTLQHGVPFQPVNIRVSTNPLSLVKLLLSQNKTSYTKLDDLISIGQNLVISMPSTIMDEATSTSALDATELTRRKAAAERKITGMTIDQALEEDDFETAYSYVVNRLSPNTPSPTPQASTSSIPFFSTSPSSTNETDDAEDVAWKAALRAGRYTSSPSSSRNWGLASNTTSRPDLRRLEQRMDLLSQALLLAPASHLEEVLRVWQMCEADMNELLARESAAEQRFNDAADRKLPGAFDMDSVAVQPQRRELGRGAVEESPMGLFDVARGAAAAFSKTAFPLRGGTTSTSQSRGSGEYTRASHDSTGSGRVSMDLADSTGSLGEERVRKRDMVASAATGALASGSGALVSGLGWVLGAKPVQERGGQERERERDGWD